MYFTTEAYQQPQRIDAWRQTLDVLSLKLKKAPAESGLHGSAHYFTSRLGILFAQLSSVSQELFLEGTGDDLWLVQHMEGDGKLTQGGTSFKVGAGDISYGPADSAVSMSFGAGFRLCLVRIPYSALQGRLLAPGALQVGLVAGQTGIGRVLGGFLESVAENMETLEHAQVLPIELALIEFVVTIFANAGVGSSSTLTVAQAGELHRISQVIEGRLADPSLSLTDIAAKENVSTRYLQKLFESAGESFSHHLRLRRLERCRADLADPLYSHLSISDILFRWGFNDAAHFSRAFRNQYGKSPRDYRQEIGEEISKSILFRISRGWPNGSYELSRKVKTNQQQARKLAKRSTDLDAAETQSATGAHHYLAANTETVHWGYFSRMLPPVMEVRSGDIITIETLTHHAYDDYDRMIKGDSGAEAIFLWTKDRKNIDRRGAGPMDASVFGRGAGEGFGVHICTGPIRVRGAKPGDVIEIRILDVRPRPCANPVFAGRAFGSNAAAWWGLHYKELLTEPRPREVVTIYEIDCLSGADTAKAVYNFRWTPQTDPFGVVHNVIDYPGIPVDHSRVVENHGVLRDIRIPVQPHFGVIALAPREAEIVDSVPPSYFGGNIDNRRAGKGTRMYLPVSVPGGLLSIGDPHASQGDSELCGTAIECSLTGVFQLVLHKKDTLSGKPFADLNYPLLETPDEWVVHGFSYPNHLAELGDKAQSEIYNKSSLDLAMRDAFHKTRRFLLAHGLSEDEAISLMSVAIDFGVTQVVDGNWCIHSIVRKALFGQRIMRHRTRA